MSKNKNRKRNAEVAANTGRITDRPKREPKDMGPIGIQISGPKHFFRRPDSMHIVAFKAGNYRNSVVLSFDELHDLRDKITAWIGDGAGIDDLRARVAYLENEREARRVEPFKPNTDSITVLDVPDTENYADAECT